MKTRSILIICLIVFNHVMFGQAIMTNGPELENDRDSKMNRILKGDDDSFYAYRVRSKGKGTSFFIEKYDKLGLKPIFSKEVNLDEEGKTKIEDVEYSQGNVFVFRRQYDRKTDMMTLFYQTISSGGIVSNNLKEIVSVPSDHYQFVNFDIYPNPGNTKFLIKASHKPDNKSPYQTDFILMDAVNQKKLWTKSVDEKLFTNTEGKTINYFSSFTGVGRMIDQEDVGFIGLHFDDNDNIYFGYTSPAKLWSAKEERYKLTLGILNASETAPKYVELGFDDDYFVRDIEFSKTKNNEIVIGGYIKDVQERKGRDLIKVGIFSFSIDLTLNQIKSKTVKFFDDEMLTRLESSSKRAQKFKYKLDYIFPIGEDVYYVGEQYREQMVIRYNNTGTTGGFGSVARPLGGATSYDVDYEYEYMDVIVAKLNSKGEFEWVKNLPLRQVMKLETTPHVFKQYIAVATNDNIYILCDDHPKNIERYAKADFEPRDLKSVSGIHGSNFVCNQLNIKSGQISRMVLMKNEDYCFAPIQERNPSFMPPSDCEIFVPGKNNEIYIYTEDRGRDRFAKIKFE